MPVGIKGQIKKDEDNNYSILCSQLGIDETGTGDFSEDIETLRNKICDKIREEFWKEPEVVQIETYSLTLNFSVEGPANHTLDEFNRKDKGEDETDDKD
jgi:hypothetical protein